MEKLTRENVATTAAGTEGGCAKKIEFSVFLVLQWSTTVTVADLGKSERMRKKRERKQN